MKADGLIDRFVECLNANGPEPLFEEEVPPSLRTVEVDGFPGLFHWRIQPIPAAPWVQAFEQRLGLELPILYRSLVNRYSFAEFELGHVLFFANTGGNLRNEAARATFCDDGLYPTLIKHRLLQIGRGAGGNYDPVCFDTQRTVDGDAPLVLIDHEDVLIRERVRIVKELYSSFDDLIRHSTKGI
jgi:hypothetical protein